MPAALTVTTWTDVTDAGDGVTSLREAVAQANGSSGADTIDFAFDFGAHPTIVLTQGRIDVSSDVTITGPGAAVLAISGNHASRIFNIDDGSSATSVAVALSDLTLTGAYGNFNSSGGFDGGAIFNAENLTITAVVLSGNVAYHSGGAIYNNYPGSLTATGSTFSSNSTVIASGGGAIYNNSGAIDLTDSTLSGNVTSGSGGAIASGGGTVQLTNTSVSNNTADSGGGIINSLGTMTITDSTVTGNTANGTYGSGGGVWNQGVLTVTSSTISGNSVTGYYSAGGGGGLYIAYPGGSVYGRATINSSTISGNTVNVFGGGVMSGAGTTLTINNSTVSGNSARYGGAVAAISNTTQITSSTLSGNTAGYNGGGVYSSFSSLALTASTVADNTASVAGGGVDSSTNGGSLDLESTILGANTSPSAADLNSPIVGVTAHDSLIESGSYTLLPGWSGVIVGVDPMLAPLADNGGPTQTQALLAGSVAINRGAASGRTTDQRGTGFPRVVGAAADIGAFEVQNTPPTAHAQSMTTDEDTSVAITLTATDDDGDALTFTVVTGPTHGSLTGSGANLIYTPFPNYNGPDGFTFKTNDGTVDSTPAAVLITVKAVDDAPTAVALSNDSVAENQPPGTLVGYLSTTDVDPGDSFAYSLVAGAGDDDNTLFTIASNLLLTNATFDFEARSSYSVRVRTTDAAGQWVESAFTITITNLTELTGFDVQKGLHERSFVRYLDLDFASPTDVVPTSRVQLTRYNLDGTGGTPVGLGGVVSATGARMSFDFGAQGIGGNRNGSAGDGYYVLSLDLDGNGSFETTRAFYRLFGDANGDRKVDAADAALVLASYGQLGPSLEGDVNGDGVVNALDRTYALRANGAALGTGLWIDD